MILERSLIERALGVGPGAAGPRLQRGLKGSQPPWRFRQLRRLLESFSKQLRIMFEATTNHFRSNLESLSKQLRIIFEAPAVALLTAVASSKTWR